jgi:hypothetical protein
MRELKKKPEAEMPVARKPAAGAELAKAGRESGIAPRSTADDRAELEVLEARLLAARDANEKKDLIEKIQRKFGNDKVAQILQRVKK